MTGSISFDTDRRELSGGFGLYVEGWCRQSTIAVNLARQLAAHDHDVLLIDFDPNGHASVGLGFDDQYVGTELIVTAGGVALSG